MSPVDLGKLLDRFKKEKPEDNGIPGPGGLTSDRSKLFFFAVVVTTIAIFLFIIIYIAYNSLNAIDEIGLWSFLTGDVWRPNSDSYGAFSLIVGTLLVTGGAMLIAIPVGIGIAIYITDVASARVRNILKPVCEIFAGIPSVVYGFLGLVVLVPILLDIFPAHLSYGTSWLAGSLVLGIMALPTIISVSQDALAAVPKSYREASLALGATKWETTNKVIIHSAVSGIAAAAILGIGRALGETIAVMMITGNSPSIPDPLWNIFAGIRTMTASIALEIPEVSYNSLHFSALFLLALVLIGMILFVNIMARRIVTRTRRKMGHAPVSKEITIFHFITKPLEPYHPQIIKGTLAVMTFMLASMMSSLFIGAVGGIVVGIVMTFLFLVSGRIAKFLGSRNIQRLVFSTLGLTVIVVLIILAAMLGIILVNGLPVLSLDFLTAPPSKGGMAGGIGPAVVGTLGLMAGTALIAFPLGICSGIYLSQYANDGKFVTGIRHIIYSMSGIPSVVFGLFGMAILVIGFGWGYTLLGGCITLSLMILPTIIKTTEEAISAVPKELGEASTALGASKWQTISRVILPASMGGVLTGTILGIGRAAGETAPIMFTAAVAFKTTLGISLFEPVMALPYHLYYLAAEVPGATANQYGTALVLMIIVIILFVVVSLIRRTYARKTGL